MTRDFEVVRKEVVGLTRYKDWDRRHFGKARELIRELESYMPYTWADINGQSLAQNANNAIIGLTLTMEFRHVRK